MFPLPDGGSRRLLAIQVRLDDPQTFAGLQSAELLAADSESNGWRRRLASAVDAALRQKASLQMAGDTHGPGGPERIAGSAKGLGEPWADFATGLDITLRDVGADTLWMRRLTAVHARASRLAQQRLDASLYHLTYSAGNATERYGSNHSL